MVVFLVLASLFGLADQARAQEGGTPPMTVIPVPTAPQPTQPAEPAPAPVPSPPQPSDTSPGPEVVRNPEGLGALSDVNDENIWLYVLAAAAAASGVTALVTKSVTSRRLGGPGPGESNAPYELLAFVFEERTPGEKGLRVLTHGEFGALDRAIEAAHNEPPIKTLAGNPTRVWWVVTSGGDGSTRLILRPPDSDEGAIKSLSRIERLLSDLDHRLRGSAGRSELEESPTV